MNIHTLPPTRIIFHNMQKNRFLVGNGIISTAVSVLYIVLMYFCICLDIDTKNYSFIRKT